MIQLDDYVIDVLMRDLVGHDRRVVSFLVYLWFAGEQRKGNAIEASYRQIAESIGVSKSSAQAAVAWLIKRKLLASTKKTVTATPRYKVMTPWRDYESRARTHSQSEEKQQKKS
jgi:hypothetical protein